MTFMPRMKGKYDRPAYYFLSPGERKARNAIFYIEKLADRDTEFAKKWHATTHEYKLGHLTKKQAEQKIWEEMQQALQRQK